MFRSLSGQSLPVLCQIWLLDCTLIFFRTILRRVAAPPCSPRLLFNNGNLRSRGFIARPSVLCLWLWLSLLQRTILHFSLHASPSYRWPGTRTLLWPRGTHRREPAISLDRSPS